jgi:anionic cell wall polymer biosynthesis LytR-Cps2A-Psr (LCP) family protein
MSPSVLPKIDDIIQSISKNFETDMSSKKISSLIKMQMNDRASWDIMMYSVKGTGDSKTTYSGGNHKLYVMIPNEATISEAKDMMNKVMNINIP